MRERRAVRRENPDAEERRLQQAIYDAEVAEREARRTAHSGKNAYRNGPCRNIERRIDQRQPDLEKMENEFSAALEPWALRMKSSSWRPDCPLHGGRNWQPEPVYWMSVKRS